MEYTKKSKEETELEKNLDEKILTKGDVEYCSVKKKGDLEVY